MRAEFRKISSDRHFLCIVRPNGASDEVTCETRSTLVHDFLHFAVEKAAALDGGFWGNLARGKTLAEMNDRTGSTVAAEAPALMAIERVVGALSSAAKGRPAHDVVDGIRRYFAALELSVPEWLTEELVLEVQERLRCITGEWNATPYGGSMFLEW